MINSWNLGGTGDCNACHAFYERAGRIYQSELLGNPLVYGLSTLPTPTSLGRVLAFVYFPFSPLPPPAVLIFIRAPNDLSVNRLLHLRLL